MMVIRRSKWALAVTPRRGAITVGGRIGQRIGVHTVYFTRAARHRAEQERLAALARVRAARMRLEAHLAEVVRLDF